MKDVSCIVIELSAIFVAKIIFLNDDISKTPNCISSSTFECKIINFNSFIFEKF
jgi:hypothetical protein